MHVSCIAVPQREEGVDEADPCAHDHAFTEGFSQSAGVAETTRCAQS